jgi:hypothetical protein
MNIFVGKKSISNNLLHIEIIAKSEKYVSAVFFIYIDHMVDFSQVIDIQEGINTYDISFVITRKNQSRSGVLAVQEEHNNETYVVGHIRIPELSDMNYTEKNMAEESLYSKLIKTNNDIIQCYLSDFNQSIENICLKGER